MLRAVESNHQIAWFRARCLTDLASTEWTVVYNDRAVARLRHLGLNEESPLSKSGMLPDYTMTEDRIDAPVGCRGFEPLISCLKDRRLIRLASTRND